MLTVGTEWLIEASGCDAEALRDVGRLRAVFARAVEELGLRVVGEPLWHKFPGEGGVTGLAMLTESHLACHTYPEFRVAAFNLYCCRERPAWPWAERLGEMIGATGVSVRSVSRETQPPRGEVPELARQPSDLLHVPSGSLHTNARGGDA
jgi:S-adenosylmethionine decarboxylase